MIFTITVTGHLHAPQNWGQLIDIDLPFTQAQISSAITFAILGLGLAPGADFTVEVRKE